MSLRLLAIIVGVLCLFTVVTGCGNGFVGMKGRVTYSDNGEPLEAGTVTFTSEMFQARGDIEKDGNYVIGSLTDNDGLPPGTYTVYISNADSLSGSQENPVKTPLIDGKYASPKTSGLSVIVDGSTKKYDFTVDRKK